MDGRKGDWMERWVGGWINARESEVLDKQCGTLVYQCKMDQEGRNGSDLTPWGRRKHLQ